MAKDRTHTPQEDPRLRQIRMDVEGLLGEPVVDILTPGGTTRASCRVVLKDRTLIATRRHNFRRTHLEASVLRALSPTCPVMPQFVALEGDLLLQSDVGGERLSQKIRTPGIDQRALTQNAVESLFAIHLAARATLSDVAVPPLGGSEAWVAGLIDTVEVLDAYQPGLSERIDRAGLMDALTVEPTQFLKWDCRSGNAAIDAQGRCNWFDFEYCGMRHGAEDFAWLIGDETWPVPAETMFEVISEALPPEMGDREAYLNYLALYSAIHCIQRLALILKETRKRGWRAKTRIVARDDVGKHPEFAMWLCQNAAFCADRNALTRPLVKALTRAARDFERILGAAKA